MSWTDGARRQPSRISISPQGPFLPDVDGHPGLGLSSSGFLPGPGSSHRRAAVDPARHRICRRQHSVPLGAANRVRFSGGWRSDLAPDHPFSIGASCRSLCTRNGRSWLSAPFRAASKFRVRRIRAANWLARRCPKARSVCQRRRLSKAACGLGNLGREQKLGRQSSRRRARQR